MNLTVIKTILKEKYWFKVSVENGSKDCEVLPFQSTIGYKGIISDNFKEINLLEPLTIKNGEDKEKKITSLKVPKESLVQVIETINN